MKEVHGDHLPRCVLFIGRVLPKEQASADGLQALNLSLRRFVVRSPAIPRRVGRDAGAWFRERTERAYAGLTHEVDAIPLRKDVLRAQRFCDAKQEGSNAVEGLADSQVFLGVALFESL